MIERPAIIRQILAHLGLPAVAPSLRAPPDPPDGSAAEPPREWSDEPCFDDLPGPDPRLGEPGPTRQSVGSRPSLAPVPTEFRLTAPPAVDSLPVTLLFSRLLGVLPVARPSPSPELRSRAAAPVSNFLSGCYQATKADLRFDTYRTGQGASGGWNMEVALGMLWGAFDAIWCTPPTPHGCG